MDSTYLAFFRFFGLHENPFNVNPDPGYLFQNQRTQNVLNDLQGAIQARKGLMVLTGDVGTGKTTLVNYLIQWLQKQRTPSAFIFNPRLQVSELFDLMLGSFAIPPGYAAPGSSLSRLSQWLLERYRLGSNAVLIIDEAQGLPAHVLEEIRVLLNQETPHEKLLQIILCGQPELEATLNRADHRQIRQRISLRCKMDTLSREETRGYIETRLRTAGARNASIFLPEAMDAAHLYSHGIPRVMNFLCEHALIRAYVEQIRPVGANIIEEVARQLQLDEVKPTAVSLASLMGEEVSNEALSLQESREDRPEHAEIGDLIDGCGAVGSGLFETEFKTEDAPLAARKFVAEVTPIRSLDAMKLAGVSKAGLRIVSSTPKESNVTEICRNTIEAGEAGARGEEAVRAGEVPRLKNWISPSEILERVRTSIDLEGLRKRAAVAMQQVSPSVQSVRGAFSRWSIEARENWGLLLHWLQQPMSTARVPRRVRH
jgi:general secretion pathway protein A